MQEITSITASLHTVLYVIKRLHTHMLNDLQVFAADDRSFM